MVGYELLLYFLTLHIVLDGYWNKSLSIKHSRDVWTVALSILNGVWGSLHNGIS